MVDENIGIYSLIRFAYITVGNSSLNWTLSAIKKKIKTIQQNI